MGNWKNAHAESEDRKKKVPDVWQVEVDNDFTASTLGDLIGHNHFDLLAWRLHRDFELPLTTTVEAAKSKLGNQKLCVMRTESMLFASLGAREPLYYERER